MNQIQVQSKILKAVPTDNSGPIVDGRELEQMVGVALLGDLNQQLADIATDMERQVQEKQTIRGEMEEIYNMKANKEVLDVEGQGWVDLTPEEARLLDVVHSASPQIGDNGEVTGYLIKKDQFEVATKGGIDIREKKLSELNSNSELTLLKIQSLVDQRKNALTLLSNLLAASNDVAKNIIGNIRS